MKKIFVLSLLAILFVNLQAQDKYVSAMKKNIDLLDSTNTLEVLIDLANNFERIALAEKEKWLPNYYSSFVWTLISLSDSVKSRMDIYLDRADLFIKKADSLQPNESEILTLKMMIAQARMQVDPMNRWAKYGGEINKYFQMAVKADSTNPRPFYLMGIQLFYTPEQFGGGAGIAKTYFEKAIEKYDVFIPKEELMPMWGRENVKYFLSEINK